MSVKKLLIVAILVVLFLLVRLYKLEERMDFSMDQGVFLLRAKEIWDNKEITLLGPTASPKVEGRQFFQGPLIYYSLTVLMLLANWDPVKASIVMILLTLAGTVVLYLAIKNWWGKEVAILSALTYGFLPFLIPYSMFLWNPNFLLVLTPIYFWLISKKQWLIAGIAAGMCLQFHFQFTLIIAGSMLIFGLKKKGLKTMVLYVGGIIIGYSPLILFDLRNNFYNVSTILKWIMSDSGKSLGYPLYYFLCLFPFVVAVGAKVINKNLLRIIITGLVAWDLVAAINSSEAFGMPKNWNYRDLVKVTDIIKDSKNSNINVANLLSGDTRFYSLRYMLAISNKAPMAVNKYNEADELFVVASNSEKDILRYPVYEVSSFANGKIKETWAINKQVNLYRLTK